MIEFKKEFKHYIAQKPKNKFWLYLSACMDNSIDDLSLENDFFLDFIAMFESIDDQTDISHWDIDISKCFYELMHLSSDQLGKLYDFMEYVEINSTDDIMALCRNDLGRGKQDIKWLLALDCFYQDLMTNFMYVRPLSCHEIISPSLQEDYPDQEAYVTDLLHGVEWYNLAKNELLNFLKTLDFHYLSDEAYYFVLLACMKVSIDMFKENEFSPPQNMDFFLDNANRASNASLEIRNLVCDFIQLLSHDRYYFLTFHNDHANKLMKIWTVK